METYKKKIHLAGEINALINDWAGINIVTCGKCGCINAHKTGAEKISCDACKFESEPCNFPDFIY